MCDREEVYSCLPSIISWVNVHTALGGSGTNCVGKSRSPSQTHSSRHWGKAHTDPQHIHINTDTLVTYLRWTSEKNLIFHGLTICLLPYRLQLGEKEGRTEEKQMSTREQWVKLCCQSLETTSAAQQDNCRALQQCWQLPPCTVPLCAEEAKSHTP